MMELTSTLIGDGSSDRTLIPILNWLLQDIVTTRSLPGTQWADLSYRRIRPVALEDRIRCAVEDYPCDVLFVHRDAEAEPPEQRRTEILNALQAATVDIEAICVVPVRMAEAWLIVDEDAIRSASGNPRGRKLLNLPRGDAIERLADPKEVLFDALRVASEHTGRRLSKLRVEERRHRVAEIMNYGHLRLLAAFRNLETELTATLRARGWA
jgi:hypothetical protein